jgi:putative peptidoglycan lipid II flippase
MQDTRTVFFLYLVENAINVVLALALYPSLGVQGLALAFSLAYSAGTVVAVAVMRRRTHGIEGRRLAGSAARVLAASAAMATVTLLCARFVGGNEGVALFARVAVGVVAGVTVYGAAARLLGVSELLALLPIRRHHTDRGKRQPG